jgi:chromosome segregation ATPase
MDDPEIRWVSYAELAEARGIDRLSAVRIARNRRWQKQKGNDGTIRVAVPRNFLETKRRDKGRLPEHPLEIPSEVTRKIIGLETRVELLNDELERERRGIAGLREERAAANARAEAAEARARDMAAEIESARGNETRLREDRAAAIAQKEAAESRVDDLSAQVREAGEGEGAGQDRARAGRG